MSLVLSKSKIYNPITISRVYHHYKVSSLFYITSIITLQRTIRNHLKKSHASIESRDCTCKCTLCMRCLCSLCKLDNCARLKFYNSQTHLPFLFISKIWKKKTVHGTLCIKIYINKRKSNLYSLLEIVMQSAHWHYRHQIGPRKESFSSRRFFFIHCSVCVRISVKKCEVDTTYVFNFLRGNIKTLQVCMVKMWK